MSGPVPRATVEAFYRAYESRDPEQIAPFLDDNVEWDVFGPVSVMQVCGQWRGKAAVIDRFARLVPQVIEFKKFERAYTLADGDQSAVYGSITSRHCATGRIISHRVAHFVRYRDGKVTSFRAINDSLDAVEQFLGHSLDLGAGQGDNDLVPI